MTNIDLYSISRPPKSMVFALFCNVRIDIGGFASFLRRGGVRSCRLTRHPEAIGLNSDHFRLAAHLDTIACPTRWGFGVD
jgi:hypothetical protein